MSINTQLSDLFFNLNFDDEITDTSEGDQFAGFDPDKLHAKAAWFVWCLEAAGFTAPLPSAGEVVKDFLGRL